jgi:hypothetical protein
MSVPFLTSNHGPSLYQLSYPDFTFPPFWSKHFPRSLSPRHLFSLLNTYRVFCSCSVHTPQTLRHRHAEHQLPLLAVLIPPGTFTLTRTLCTSLVHGLGSVQLNAARVKSQAAPRAHLVQTWTADWRWRVKQVTS